MRNPMPCGIHKEKLFKALVEVVKKYNCDCIALSGGIDTSTILLVSRLAGLKPRSYVVVYREGLPKDLIYVNNLAKVLNVDVEYIFIDSQDVEDLRRKVVECIGREKIDSHGDGGCIEVRNDMVFYAFLKKAKEDSCRCVFTGSGGDEVFAGYSFMLTKVGEELEKSIERLSRGRFPEIEIGRCLGVKVVAPFLEENVLKIALQIPVNCLRSETTMGKEILRHILEEHGLYAVARRAKTPAESGAGTKAVCRSLYDD